MRIIIHRHINLRPLRVSLDFIKITNSQLKLQPYKKFNDVNEGETRLKLNFKQNFAPWKEKIYIFDSSTNKIGKKHLNNEGSV